jgi:hypothetical protein
MQCCGRIPTFQRSMLPPSSESSGWDGKNCIDVGPDWRGVVLLAIKKCEMSD